MWTFPLTVFRLSPLLLCTLTAVGDKPVTANRARWSDFGFSKPVISVLEYRPHDPSRSNLIPEIARVRQLSPDAVECVLRILRAADSYSEEVESCIKPSFGLRFVEGEKRLDIEVSIDCRRGRVRQVRGGAADLIFSFDAASKLSATVLPGQQPPPDHK